MMTHLFKKIAITQGEPAGIGPDIILQALRQTWSVPLILLGCPTVFSERAQLLKLTVKFHELTEVQLKDDLPPLPKGHAYLFPMPMPSPTVPGQLNSECAQSVLEVIKFAVNGCKRGWFSAMVTAPIHKGIINEAGIPFTGHTEFLKELTHAPHVVMMLATQSLKVALVTTHLPLHQVSAALTAPHLASTLRIVHQAMQQLFKMDSPRILVAGLNPHAGEGGYLGTEEITTITPVIQTLQAEGLNLEGPLPADTLFTPAVLTRGDVVVAMYHDQGLPVIKHLGFEEAVNVTLGLPIIRTSVDHGTALTLAGTGRASDGSLRAALRLAILIETVHASAEKPHPLLV